MAINIIYFMLGIIIGFTIKYDIDLKKKKNIVNMQKKMVKNTEYFRTNASLKQIDEALETIRGINEKLQLLQQKEVR